MVNPVVIALSSRYHIDGDIYTVLVNYVDQQGYSKKYKSSIWRSDTPYLS